MQTNLASCGKSPEIDGWSDAVSDELLLLLVMMSDATENIAGVIAWR